MVGFNDKVEVPLEDQDIIHSRFEIGNVFRCSRILREWLNNPTMPSNYAVTLLHATLFDKVERYSKKGLLPNKPGDYRVEDIKVSGEPENFYARGLDVKFLMREYAEQLDKVIQTLPTNPDLHTEDVINQAAWTYYTFIRIHPFLDGNGRVSRFVLQRVLKGAGFKDIVFTQEVSHGKKRFLENRNRHLDTMNQVDKTGNLAYLEIYLASLLLSRYHESDPIYKELQELITKKRGEIQSQKQKQTLVNIWPRFKDIDIHGGFDESSRDVA